MYYCVYMTFDKKKVSFAQHYLSFDSLKGAARFLFNTENNNKLCKGNKKYDYQFFSDDLTACANKKDFPYTWELSNKDSVVIFPGYGFGMAPGKAIEDWAKSYAIDYEEATGTKSKPVSSKPRIDVNEMFRGKNWNGFNHTPIPAKPELVKVIRDGVKKKKKKDDDASEPITSFIVGNSDDSDENIGPLKGRLE
jgi:hypothetical protein